MNLPYILSSMYRVTILLGGSCGSEFKAENPLAGIIILYRALPCVRNAQPEGDLI